MPLRKIRVHIENARNAPGLFQITPASWDAACARHRRLARRLEVTVGWDGDILGNALNTAEVLIGVPARRHDLARRAPRLRWVHATSAGVDDYLPLDWLPERAARMGRLLLDQLRAAAARHASKVTAVRGQGLLVGVDLKPPVGDVVTACRQRGLLALTAGDNTLRLAPPLVIDEAGVERGVAIIDKALGDVAG